MTWLLSISWRAFPLRALKTARQSTGPTDLAAAAWATDATGIFDLLVF